MGFLSEVYKNNLSLLTDLYQLSMGYAYWKSGLSEREACFYMYYRRPPFGGKYAIAAGLENVYEWCKNLRFTEEDVQYLSTLRGSDGKPLFDWGFLTYLRALKFECTIDAVPEGTVVFPNEPLVRVMGPLFQAQYIETFLLNQINFQTLIATKAAHICRAAKGDTVLEFGLRRAQGIDGSLSATRASFIGGVHATSNVMAGKVFDIPVKGTHAHSWVMVFESEIEAFDVYAKAMPNNCVFLVDTYNTEEGVRNAIKAGRKLQQLGKEMVGVRLDSGDLAGLSIMARKMLDEAGFQKAKVFASNDLDEKEITRLKEGKAAIAVWGVGTNMVTGGEQSALGGVYKLSCIADEYGVWQNRVKLSEQEIKVSLPGLLNTKRLFSRETHAPVTDKIFSESIEYCPSWLDENMDSFNLLEGVFLRGRPAGDFSNVDDKIRLGRARLRRAFQMERFDKRGDALYPVVLDINLYEQKNALIDKAKSKCPSSTTL